MRRRLAISNCRAPDRRITIRAACPNPRTVEIAVSDAGIGIPPADLQRVLDSFHTTKPDGLGLGLSICRSIVEAHGGSITLRNNPERGVTACVSLPVEAVESKSASELAAACVPSAVSTSY